jgi:hypothetical protein
MLGNNYRSKKKYYGEYPPTYLKRISALVGSKVKNVLHLFSGVVEKGYFEEETTFDINSELHSDVTGDAHHLSSYFGKEFDCIIADPLYSKQDAERYNTAMVNRRKVISECHKILKRGGLLLWLDQMLPMFRKDKFALVGSIGIVRSTNHRIRLLSIFKAI